MEVMMRSAIAVPKASFPAFCGSASPSTSNSTAYFNPLLRTKTKASRFVVRASKSGDHRYDSDHSMVDANMIVLRKRIQELKLLESKNELPQEWMEWEKKMYPSYQSNVFQLVGWLQNCLMTTRPGVAVTLLGLVCLGAPTCVYLATMAGIQYIGVLKQALS